MQVFFVTPFLAETMAERRVTWSLGSGNSRMVRGFCYLQIAVFGGMALVIAGSIVGLFALTLWSGNYRVLGLLVLLTLVGGPFSLLYLLPLLTDPEQRPPMPETWREFRRLSVGGTVVAATLGAVALVAAFAVGSPVLLASMFVVLLAAFAAGKWLTSDGVLDPDVGSLTYANSEIDIDAITDVRQRDIGGYAVVTLSHDAGVGMPRWLVLPGTVADEVVPVLDRTAEDAEAADTQSLAATAALVALGLGTIAGGAGLAVLGRNADKPVALYWIAAWVVAVGCLFLWIAWIE